MAREDDEKKRLSAQEFSRLTSLTGVPSGAVGGQAIVGGVPARTPATQPLRDANISPAIRSPSATAAAIRTVPTRQPVPPRVDTSPAASDARIRAIANEGRVPDRRAAPPVIDERPAGGRSAFAPDIQGAAAPTGVQLASPEEIARYRASVAQRGVEGQEEAYRRALEGTTLSSGDTWFNFMQKNQQRAALISARKAGLEGEKLASAERLQERRGALEAGLQQERFGAERGLLADRLSAAEREAAAQRDFDRPFKESAMRSQEADIGYKGALGEEAGARGELARMTVEEARQKRALQEEYAAEGTSPERRNRIAQILQGGELQKTELPGILKSMLGVTDSEGHRKLVSVYAKANQAASDPASRYFGNPDGAFADYLAALEQPQGDTTYAQGGVVDAEGYAQGGAIGAQQFGGLPDVDETATLARMYSQYAQTTQAMGATPVDFGKFSTLMTTVRDRMAVPAQEPSAMGMPGYAEGGAVDVSGRQVLGPGTGTSDSIPAIIDGQTPAALSTNEFVWTANATENASPAVLKAVMSGLERNDPEIVSGIMALAAKAVKKPAQPAVE